MRVAATTVIGSPGAPNGLAPATLTASSGRPFTGMDRKAGSGTTTSMTVRLEVDSRTRNASSSLCGGNAADASSGEAASAGIAAARIRQTNVPTRIRRPGWHSRDDFERIRLSFPRD